MVNVTASMIVSAINHLPKRQIYQYANPATREQIEIQDVVLPEGPIWIKRYNPSKGEPASAADRESISTQMIWRIANAFMPNQPINFDRILGGSYNTRSVLEALLVHTPQFYICYPGRIESMGASSTIKPGHKHVIWCPDEPHTEGSIGQKQVNVAISEMPSIDAFYESLALPDNLSLGEMDINVQRRHAQIQIALVMIGKQLGFRTWVARNDIGIIYNNQRIGELDGVLSSLNEDTLVTPYQDAIRAALLIDCVWFKNGKAMPAVMEIEHTTGITSGLTRMKGLQDALPAFQTRYVIVAPDEDREKAVREINRPQFESLKARFFPYSAVEELYALCQKRRIRGITDDFLDCYMEPAV